MPPVIREEDDWRKTVYTECNTLETDEQWITSTYRLLELTQLTFLLLFYLSTVSFPTHRVQRSCSSHVRQEANLQHMKQEVLVLNTIHSVKEQDHGGLVVWHKTGGHLGLNNLTICGLDRRNHICSMSPKFPPSFFFYTVCSYTIPALYLTFAVGRNLHRQADDSHQVLNGHQRPQDGPDSESFTLACLDQL